MTHSHLICFAAGAPIYTLNRMRLLDSARQFDINHIHSFGSEEIDKEFRDANRAVLDSEAGAGSWLWKPYFIRETMRRAPQGDIIIYSDTGTYLRRSPDPLWNLNPHTDLFLFENDYVNRAYVKRDAFILSGTDSESCHNSKQLDAAFMLFRNTPAAQTFVNAWLDLCRDPRVVTDAPNSCGSANLPGFIAHRHDQSALSLLFWRERSRLRYALYPRSLKHRFIVHHRRRTPTVPIWAWHLFHDGFESLIRRMVHVDLRQA